MAGLFKGSDGNTSTRRVLAFFFALVGAGLFVVPFFFDSKVTGWGVFIPGIICISASLLLLFFTTWSALTDLARAVKGKEAPEKVEAPFVAPPIQQNPHDDKIIGIGK